MLVLEGTSLLWSMFYWFAWGKCFKFLLPFIKDASGVNFWVCCWYFLWGIFEILEIHQRFLSLYIAMAVARFLTQKTMVKNGETAIQLTANAINPLSANPTKWTNTLKQFVATANELFESDSNLNHILSLYPIWNSLISGICKISSAFHAAKYSLSFPSMQNI